MDRFAVLAEGYLRSHNGKTAHGILRFRPENVAVVIDSQNAGSTVNAVMPGYESAAPIVASVREALSYKPTSLLVGVATDGGAIPQVMRKPILDAADAGLSIVSGLHQLLADDPQIVEHAKRSGARLWDVRVPPRDIPLFSGAAYAVPQQVVLAVGSDCAVGKMTAMLEIEKAAISAGVKAEFIATGQTGIMIAGKGIAVDRVISDFVTGAAEQLVLGANADSQVLLVEGQGAIFHPAYAPVTFGLLYGSAPDALVLCHRPGSGRIHGFAQIIPDLRDLVSAHESLLQHVKPARVVAIALDTSSLSMNEARLLALKTEAQIGLVTSDPVREGGAKIWKAIAANLTQTKKARSALTRT